jgi:hypothetical protein
LKCVDRIKAYLNGTRNYGLKVDVEDMTLQASVDASHGIHPEDSKGHTGMVLSLSNSPVFSRSVKQKCVATSSTHAEILAAYESVSYIVSLRQLLEELNYPQPTPTVIQQDNKSALQIYEKGWSSSNKTRHIRSKKDQMLADHLTKPLEGKVDMTEHTSVKQLLSRVARPQSRNALAGIPFRQHSNPHTLK